MHKNRRRGNQIAQKDIQTVTKNFNQVIWSEKLLILFSLNAQRILPNTKLCFSNQALAPIEDRFDTLYLVTISNMRPTYDFNSFNIFSI